MKVSIITVCYNSVSTIKDTIDSVVNQTYSNIEHIIIDGASNDGTLEVINSYGDKIDKVISEPDNGIYNAMNKGIGLATGDIVGILNADDFFTTKNIINKIVDAFNDENLEAVFGDVQFIDPKKGKNKIVRYYSSKHFHPGKFKYGFMPAHPGFYVKRIFYESLGYYAEDYEIGSDYELLVRFLHKNKLAYKYVEIPFVTMRTGGISNKSLKSRFVLNREVIRACRENGLKTNWLLICSKYFRKIFELMGNKR